MTLFKKYVLAYRLDKTKRAAQRKANAFNAPVYVFPAGNRFVALTKRETKSFLAQTRFKGGATFSNIKTQAIATMYPHNPTLHFKWFAFQFLG